MGLGLAGICDLCRILVFLNVLYAPQQLGNRTLPRTRPEPWMANAPMRPAKAASGRFCRSSGCVKLSIHKSEHLENIISGTRHRQSVIVSRYSEPLHKKGAKDGRAAKTRKKQNPHKAMSDYNHSPFSDNNACGSPDIGNGKCHERRHRLLS